ncbi:MAG: pyrimidine dimer DNA glycosylase/endonuclease V [Patescibacteria group bacterium]|jgi:hypothetical protein
MRIWSIHPKYLDSIGLIACWREALLGQVVLLGKTKWYKNHPQLLRFKNSGTPLSAIIYYLTEIYNEAKSRGYNFDYKKIWKPDHDGGICFNTITVNKKQLIYELKHLYQKLEKRNIEKYNELHDLFFENIFGMIDVNKIEAHPLFTVVDGEIEEWEKIKNV